MILGRMLCLMGRGHEKLRLHLKRSVSDKARKLSLRRNLRRHEIQYQYFQRTDILRDRTVLRYNEYIFLGQRFRRREQMPVTVTGICSRRRKR